MDNNFEEITNKLINVIQKYRSILIFIKGSPDPDVIASSFALKIICDRYNVKSDIVALSATSLPQNKAIIDELNIPIRFEKSINNISHYNAYSILDYQSVYVQGISEKIPCAIHIDHHEAIEELVKAEFALIMQDVGSVSTIMTIILENLGYDNIKHLITKVSTALLYGIYTDTDGFKLASDLDYKAINYLSPYYDRTIIKNVVDLPFSEEMINYIGEAIRNQEIYKDWVITGIGYLDESQRDYIAIIADFLLSREKVTTVIVFAAIEKNKKTRLTLDASIRTKDKNIDLNNMINQISAEGGARRFKGSYQINLDYFAYCSDKIMLWDLLNNTTIEIIKKSRDRVYFSELKDIYGKLKKRISEIL
ncbi:MAG: hypothetical protein SVR08_05310 [Spirochaetota bacterium]|nr:hypothetical protein [Spirochaetota bacterium]